MTTYEYNVQMSCAGCSGAITKIVNKFENIESVTPDLDTQKVTVVVKEGETTDEEKMFKKIQKWAKASNKEVSRA